MIIYLWRETACRVVSQTIACRVMRFWQLSIVVCVSDNCLSWREAQTTACRGVRLLQLPVVVWGSDNCLSWCEALTIACRCEVQNCLSWREALTVACRCVRSRQLCIRSQLVSIIRVEQVHRQILLILCVRITKWLYGAQCILNSERCLR